MNPDPFLGLFEARTPRQKSRTERLFAAAEARRQCAKDGHQYQVHGRQSPTKVACKRCRVTWSVGPRTEPVDE